MRLLFVKPALVWPRTSGHDVQCYYLMKALSEEGAEVSLATIEPTDPRAVEGIRLAHSGQLDTSLPAAPSGGTSLTYLQERFRSFWGIEKGHIESVRRLAEQWAVDVVVAFGLPALPFLGGVEKAVRVWAMADEWMYHHLSQVQIMDRTTWHHVRSAAIKGQLPRCSRALRHIPSGRKAQPHVPRSVDTAPKE